MPIDYEDLFRTAAPYLEQIVDSDDRQARLRSLLAPTLNRHTTYGSLDAVERVETAFRSMRSAHSSVISRASSQLLAVLTDADLVRQHLPIPASASTAEVLTALLEDLAAQSASTFYVTPTNITLTDPRGGSPVTTQLADTPFLANNSSEIGYLHAHQSTKAEGTRLVVVPFLDGVNSPTAGIAPDLSFGRSLTQFANDGESLRCICTADSETGGVTAGQESFSLFGNAQAISGNRRTTSLFAPASTRQSSLPFANNTTGMFTSWTSNVPNGWTVQAGAAGTNFSEEAHTTAFGGVGSTFLIAAGSSNIDVRSAIPQTRFLRNAFYLLSWWELTTSAQNVAVDLVPDGSTTATTNTVIFNTSLNQAEDDPTTQVFKGEPAYGSSAWRLQSKLYWSNNDWTVDEAYIRILRSGSGEARIASVALTPLTYAGGLGLVVVPGPTIAREGDEIQVDVGNTTWTNSSFTLGRLSRALRLATGRQFPLVYDNTTADSADLYLDEDLTTVP